VEVVYRVNAGGIALAGTPPWSVDTAANPSPLHNTGTKVYGNGHTIVLTHSSIPVGTPEAVFQSERYAPNGGLLSWDFAVAAGEYEVRMYFAEIWTGTQAVGARMFDVSIEGVQVLDDYDVFATVGSYAGVVESFIVTSDGNLDIDLTGVVQNPSIKGIEIIRLA
jgi:hypothetical protein